jgi:DNA invertase Pin-like site-specific DNA recombinase
MSTEHQRYSIENQKNAIAAYASTHRIKVVRSYINPGRSGLRIDRRDALQQLIADVQTGQADFNAILVYNVSRWGRFQDIDESAYYEFLCKRAGAPIRYCAEQFGNNGTLIAQLIKSLKRVMAGEYSRELSVKIFEAQKYAALRGTYQGGTPAYGLRRLLVDEFGNPRTLLKTGERKHFQTDHIVLAPGPPSEIRTLKRIFRLFVQSRMTRRHIAKLLNADGLPNAVGNRWTDNNVLRVLTNEKYIGNVIYAKTSKKLQGPCFYNPPESWIRAVGVLQRIVDPELFATAQRILANPWWAFTDNQLLDHLTEALCRNGYLTASVMAKSKFTPAAITYRERFGSLTNAYRLIGYKPTHG